MTQPDKLFRDKFENFRKPAPGAAWDRIERRLDKKNSSTPWLRIAATVTIVVSAAIAVWVLKSSPDNSQLAKAHETKIKPRENSPDAKAAVSPRPDKTDTKDTKKDDQSVRQSHRARNIKRQPGNAAEKSRIDADLAQNAPVVPVESTNKQEAEGAIDANAEPLMTEPVIVSAAQDVSQQETGVVLVLSAEEVNEKYLDKKSIEEATTDDKKQSTLRKLLDKAYDLKHNQDPLGDLRQKKNEILALNFKNDKQRSQNR